MSVLDSEKQGICRWRRRKEDRPAEIMASALKIFTVKGYAATKLDDVAKQAGVSKGTLYLYFKSKEALFKAMVSEFVVPQIANAEKQAENYTGSVKDFMHMFLKQWQTNVLENELSGIPKIIMAEASNFPELTRFFLTNVIQRTRKFVANLIRLGIKQGEFRECDPEYAARAFLTPLVFSAIWKHSLASYDETYDVSNYLEFHIDNFIRGISKVNKHE